MHHRPRSPRDRSKDNHGRQFPALLHSRSGRDFGGHSPVLCFTQNGAAFASIETNDTSLCSTRDLRAKLLLLKTSFFSPCVHVYSMFDRRRSITGPGSPALARAMSSSVLYIQSVSSLVYSADGLGLPFGGISLSRIRSSESSHTTGSRFTRLSEVKRSKSRSPFCFFVE